MNFLEADKQNLEEIERRMRTRIAFIKQETLEALKDLQTVRHKALIIEEAAKDFDAYTSDLIANVIGFAQKQLPSEDDIKADARGIDPEN